MPYFRIAHFKNIFIFNNMKPKSVLQVLCGLCIPLFVSCLIYEEKPFWIHLSSDDLSYLIYDKDTCIFYDGTEFNYIDSAYYLQDDKDTIQIGVNTLINTWSGIGWWITDRAGGYTHFGYNDDFDFSMSVDITREDDTIEMDKRFDVFYKRSHFNYSTWDQDSTITPDTAKILGKIYTDVIKFSPNASSVLKKIYFAKNNGYIYIELKDGKNLKLIKYKKKNKSNGA